MLIERIILTVQKAEFSLHAERQLRIMQRALDLFSELCLGKLLNHTYGTQLFPPEMGAFS